MLFCSQLLNNDQRVDLEVCPQAAVLVHELANRVARDNGFALLADYGHAGEKGDTFRVS